MEILELTCKKVQWIHFKGERSLWIVPNEKTSIRKAKKELKKRKQARLDYEERSRNAPRLTLAI